jgi:hypothetical protein
MHRAVAAIDDAECPVPTPIVSPWLKARQRAGRSIEDYLHSWDHYGQSVECIDRPKQKIRKGTLDTVRDSGRRL